MRVHLLISILVLAAAAHAQRTWVVDLQNRPGTDFTDLPQAVQAAASGDTLRVRWVAPALNLCYSAPAAAIDKGLKIIGDAGRPASGRSPAQLEVRLRMTTAAAI